METKTQHTEKITGQSPDAETTMKPPISREEYNELKEAISEFAAWQGGDFPAHLKRCFRYAASMIPYNEFGEPIDEIANDAMNEMLLIDLVDTIARIRKAHNTYVNLPEYETLKQTS